MALKNRILPVDNSSELPSFIERLDIDGNFYDFRFDWNTRDTCWLLTLLTPEGVVLLGGVKLVLDFELMLRHKVTGLPVGSLVLLDFTGTLEWCDFDDLGTKCQLVYTTEEEEEA